LNGPRVGRFAPLRLTVYDRTCKSRGVGLSTVWGAGAGVYRGLGRNDATRGVESWAEALEWIAKYEPDRPIAEIQYWGHGKWGCVYVANDGFDGASLAAEHAHAPRIDAIRDRLLPNGESLVWLRTCEAFGADAGIDFAYRLAHRLRAKVAGHTYIIGALQSGLRVLEPGKRPRWSASEGLAEGSPAQPKRAHTSRLLAPRTIGFMTNSFPKKWFAEDGA
jgi:hypothetical protein